MPNQRGVENAGGSMLENGTDEILVTMKYKCYEMLVTIKVKIYHGK